MRHFVDCFLYLVLAKMALSGLGRRDQGIDRLALADRQQCDLVDRPAGVPTGTLYLVDNKGQVFRDSNHVLVRSSRYTRF